MQMRQVVAAVNLASKIHEDAAKRRYRSAREVTGYWGMIDLSSSAAFRQSAGDEAGYVRSEAFTATIRDIAGEYDGLSVFKELGDGLLLQSENFRPLFEFACVLDSVKKMWRVESDLSPQQPSFDYKFAITQGTCTRLERTSGSDYLGQPLDLVARLSGHVPQQDACAVVVLSSVRADVETRITREYPFASFGPDVPLDARLSKAGEAQRWLSELLIDRASFLQYEDYFDKLRLRYKP